MPAAEFFIRLKMTNEVSPAGKRKSRRVHSGKSTERTLIQKTADTTKSEFVQDRQSSI